LNAAFEQAWEFVQQSGDVDLTAEEHARTSIALHVIAIARTGENNIRRLTEEAIVRFRQQLALEDREPDSRGG